MSLILDALNRSRTESDPVPGLASQPIYLEDPPSPLRRWFPWAALCVALVLVAWLVWERLGESSSEQQDEVGSATVAAAVAQPVAAAPTAAAGVEGKATAKVATEPAIGTPSKPVQPLESAPKRVVAAVPGTVPGAVSGAVPGAGSRAVNVGAGSVRNTPAAPQQPAETRAANAAVAQLYKNPPPAKSTPAAKPKPAVKPEAAAKPRAASPPDVDKLVAMAEQARKEAALEDHPAPFVTALSQPQKDAIPTLLYERHDYNSDTGRSAVVINGRSVRAGGAVGSGVRVEEILSDSVVLKHGDTVFRLRALNSWVNL